YVAAYDRNLGIYDLSDITHPLQLSAYAPVSFAQPVYHVTSHGDRVYIRLAGAPSAIESVNVTDPRAPAAGEWAYDTTGVISGAVSTVDGAFGYFLVNDVLLIMQLCDLPP